MLQNTFITSSRPGSFQGKSSSQPIQGQNLLEKSKLSSTVLFHKHLAAATRESRFHFLPLYFSSSSSVPDLPLLEPSLELSWLYGKQNQPTKPHLDHSPHFVNGISLEYYQMNTISSVHKQQGTTFFQRNRLNWLQLNETAPLHTAPS